MKLTIIKYNKKNVCVLPILPKYKDLLMEYYKDDPNKKLKSNVLYIISGINYIPYDYWMEVKNQVMVKILIDEKIIEEMEIKDDLSFIEKEKIEELKNNKIQEIENLKKEIEIEDNPSSKKDKGKKVKELQKEVSNLEKEKNSSKEVQFNNLNKKEKEKIIKETFDIRSLKKFLNEEMEADIRHNIQLRIDEVLNAKTDVTIGHPESHLKTSGK